MLAPMRDVSIRQARPPETRAKNPSPAITTPAWIQARGSVATAPGATMARAAMVRATAGRQACNGLIASIEKCAYRLIGLSPGYQCRRRHTHTAQGRDGAEGMR